MSTYEHWQAFRTVAPGVGVLIALAGTAWAISTFAIGVNPLIIAIILGFIVANGYGVPDWAGDGVGTHKLWLEAGIVVMGAQIALGTIIDAGPTVLLFIVGVLAFTVVFVEIISRGIFDLPDKMGSLLASGSGVCGVSAIVATAASIRANGNHIAYAVATILLFDMVTLALYPVIGRLLALPDIVFGIWAGVSMYSTGPVVAAGFAYSTVAGEWATITKLTRNALIGLVAVGYALYYARRGEAVESVGNKWRYVWDKFPKFVIGFLFAMLLASAVALSEAQLEAIEGTYQGLFLVAFVGLGISMRFEEMREAGLTPIAVIVTALVTVSTLSLGLAYLLFHVM